MNVFQVPYESLNIKDGYVTGVNEDALKGHSLYSVFIPREIDGVVIKGIKEDAFALLSGLVELKLAKDSEIESIEANAFHSCSRLVLVDINRHSLKSIGQEAFYHIGVHARIVKTLSTSTSAQDKLFCSLCKKGTAKKMDLRNTSLTDLGMHAFADSEINSVYLPKTLEIIPKGLFKKTTLSKINLNELSNLCTIGQSAFEGTKIEEIPSFFFDIICFDESAFADTSIKHLEIPEYVIFSAGCFQHCHQLETVKFTGSRVEIPANSFNGCVKLKSVELPDGLEKISFQAFGNTESLEEIIYPLTLTTISDSAFFASGIKCFKPQTQCNIEVIEEYAFAKCKQLTDIDVNSKTLYNIGLSAFEDTYNLKDIDFGETSITEFPASLFFDSKLENIIFPLSLQSIAVGAFCRTGLNGVLDFSNTQLVKIDNKAFVSCPITEAKFPYFISEICKDAFQETPIDLEKLKTEYPFLDIIA